ncbi:DUF1269 domain-containing protein [Gordonia sp. NPDC003504]
MTAAAILRRDENGRLNVTEGGDVKSGDATVGGSLLGMLIGVLGGPLGVLLGFGLGAAGGALVDASRADDCDVAITEFGKTIRPGGNAILAETDEADTAAFDALVAKYGGAIVRRPLDEVLAEIEAQQDAAEAVPTLFARRSTRRRRPRRRRSATSALPRSRPSSRAERFPL